MKTATIRKDTRLATERKKIMRKVRATEGKHQGEPTCDNCDMMTIRQSGSGNHRHCDLMNLYIPDYEMFPCCELHTWQNATSRKLAKKDIHWETSLVKEGGEA